MSLFGDLEPAPDLPDGVVYRPGLVPPALQAELIRSIGEIAAEAPFRHPRTRGGGTTSAAMTNAGKAGWWSDAGGYRYVRCQPDGERPWPPMPDTFRSVVALAAAGTPWPAFDPDACLINFYQAGAKMGLHQDRDEKDFSAPIVTVCLGDDADFLMGGVKRTDKTVALRVRSGDVILMGGSGRLLFHGIRKIHSGTSPLADVAGRYSLTFRKAL